MIKNLSKRIQTLTSLVHGFDYETIFDTCCDHGKIGLSFLEIESVKFNQLYLIDIVPHIIEELNLVIADIPMACASIKTKTLSFTEIDFEKSDLVIMAGVGSQLILKALDRHHEKGLNPKHYLISSHTKHLYLRKELDKRGFSLIKEHLIYEDGLFYDHILVEMDGKRGVSSINQTGESLDLQNYYKNLASFFSLKAQHGDKESLHNLNIINNLMI